MTKQEAKKLKIGSRVMYQPPNHPIECYGRIVDVSWTAVQIQWDDGETFTYRLDGGASCVRPAP